MITKSGVFSGSVILLFASLSTTVSSYAQEARPGARALEGRWDMVVTRSGKEFPAWLEVKRSGPQGRLVGRFVGDIGSARPISEVKFNDGKFSFSIPPQFEKGSTNLDFEGTVTGSELKGTMLYTDGNTYNWVASKAPSLRGEKNVEWGTPINLINPGDLKGWHAFGESQWTVESGILKTPGHGANLATDQTFKDFKLHIEFRLPKGSNSGFYLRGRYELQISDSKGSEPDEGRFGAIYGFIAPSEMMAKDPGEWQTFDITLIGRMVTLVANGTTVISDQAIPGITGGAIDSKEGEPGPLLIQGDHGPIEFRSIIITPAK